MQTNNRNNNNNTTSKTHKSTRNQCENVWKTKLKWTTKLWSMNWADEGRGGAECDK